jgi:hypothetical protein
VLQKAVALWLLRQPHENKRVKWCHNYFELWQVVAAPLQCGACLWLKCTVRMVHFANAVCFVLHFMPINDILRPIVDAYSGASSIGRRSISWHRPIF